MGDEVSVPGAVSSLTGSTAPPAVPVRPADPGCRFALFGSVGEQQGEVRGAGPPARLPGGLSGTCNPRGLQLLLPREGAWHIDPKAWLPVAPFVTSLICHVTCQWKLRVTSYREVSVVTLIGIHPELPNRFSFHKKIAFKIP